MLRTVVLIMLTAINLNDELSGMTAEIDDVFSNGNLTPEMGARNINVAQAAPQVFLCGGG